MKKTVRILSLVIALLLTVLCIGACSNSYAPNGDTLGVMKSDGSAAEYGEYDNDGMLNYSGLDKTEPEAPGDEKTEVTDITASQYQRKIIYNVKTVLESRDFDDAIAKIRSLVSENFGYIESSQVSGVSYSSGKYYTRSAYFTIRVPADKLDGYVDTLGTFCNVTSTNTSTRDVTETYYDVQARLDAYRVQEERLLAMLEGSTDLEYMLRVEDKLSEVRYYIDSLQSTINAYDAKVEYSTVEITLREVVDYTKVTGEPETYIGRLWDSFKNSMTDFGVWLGDALIGVVYALPWLIFLAVIAIVIIVIVKGKAKKRKAKKAAAVNEGEKKS